MAGSDRKKGWGDQRGKERRSGRDRRTGIERRKERPGRVRSDRRSGAERRQPAGDPALEAALMRAATAARERARAPFSTFKVGAALETAGGNIVTGCNVENATYGLTMCAERVAIFKAVSDGHRDFARIVVVADTAEPTPPCGACRQLLWEFCGDIEVVLANLDGVTGRCRLSSLLPLPFDSRLLR